MLFAKRKRDAKLRDEAVTRQRQHRIQAMQQRWRSAESRVACNVDVEHSRYEYMCIAMGRCVERRFDDQT